MRVILKVSGLVYKEAQYNYNDLQFIRHNLQCTYPVDPAASVFQFRRQIHLLIFAPEEILHKCNVNTTGLQCLL